MSGGIFGLGIISFQVDIEEGAAAGAHEYRNNAFATEDVSPEQHSSDHNVSGYGDSASMSIADVEQDVSYYFLLLIYLRGLLLQSSTCMYQEARAMLIGDRQTLARLYPYMLWTTPRNQEANAMLIGDRQTLARLYLYMSWTTPGNQEARAMLIGDRKILARLYLYMLWTTPGNQEARAMLMLIAGRQTLARLYPYMLSTTPQSQDAKTMLLEKSSLNKNLGGSTIQ